MATGSSVVAGLAVRARISFVLACVTLLLPIFQSSAIGETPPYKEGSVYDTSPTIESTIVLGEKGFDNGSPSSISINQRTNMVYVSNRNSDHVSVINATTNKVVESIVVGYAPGDLVVNSNTSLVYVTIPNAGSVIVIDGSTNKIVKTIELATSKSSKIYNIGGIAVNEKTNKIYVLTHEYDTEGSRGDYAAISVIDGSTNGLEQSFKFADLRTDIDVTDDPRGIAINTKTNTIYVVLIFGDMYVIDANTNTVTALVTIGYEKMPHQVAVDEGTGKVYTSNFGNQSISIINASANKFITTLSSGYDPQGIAIDTSTNTVYLVMLGGEVVVIDGKSNEIKDRIKVGEFAERAATNSHGYLYVTNAGSNTISVIDTKSNTVNTDNSDWKTARIYISNEGYTNATVRYKLTSGAIEEPYIDANSQTQYRRDTIVADPYFQSLSIPINSNSPGTLTIELPRNIIDSKMNDNLTDKEFSPIIRTYPWPTLRDAAYQELNRTDTARILAIQYPARQSNAIEDQVEVIINGQLFIPEFAGSFVIFVIAMSLGTAVLIKSRRNPLHMNK